MNDWPFRPNTNGGVDQLKRGRWMPLAGSMDNAGYHLASWAPPEGKRRFKRVHCIVWQTYHGAIPEGMEVDHIDMDKSNNAISNLRLLTHHQNMLEARKRLGNWSPSKLKPHQVELLLAIPEGWRCLHQLAARWGVNKYTLGNLRAHAKSCDDVRYLATL